MCKIGAVNVVHHQPQPANAVGADTSGAVVGASSMGLPRVWLRPETWFPGERAEEVLTFAGPSVAEQTSDQLIRCIPRDASTNDGGGADERPLQVVHASADPLVIRVAPEHRIVLALSPIPLAGSDLG